VVFFFFFFIVMRSFEFLLNLYLMHKITRITDLLCLSRSLQQKSLDILNEMDLVSTIKTLLRTLRDVIFDLRLGYVQFFSHNMRILIFYL
jgi:hypothetical protein